jgi:hypothetical protein
MFWTCLSKAFGAGVMDGEVAAVVSEIKVMVETRYTRGASLAPPYLADPKDGKGEHLLIDATIIRILLQYLHACLTHMRRFSSVQT